MKRCVPRRPMPFSLCDHMFRTFLLAGWWCLRRVRHSHILQVSSACQHSYLCARSCSNLPFAPSCVTYNARCLQGGGVHVGAHVADNSATVTFELCSIIGNAAIDAVRAQVQKFLSPCRSVHMFCACACREVVSMSMAVQLHSAAARSTPM